jgi:hypothetical protein
MSKGREILGLDIKKGKIVTAAVVVRRRYIHFLQLVFDELSDEEKDVNLDLFRRANVF